ncbi:MAG: bifunctional 5,10-methylene-tetrahydrofolate dehydrogenase/5,10-methylene-tetrahydrofolate cyclohydrolase [Muribaculaceae bacterium]|nr:bifunctional 5,10-methylene-tetrahydrofolate dehydrogenase/5,10-methylene-tetrahydrofolate cyclohydrolase [Muribaculaceae bacterium]
MTLIDGKHISEQIIGEIAREVDTLARAGRRPPHLVAVLVGHDGASEGYVAAKMRACARCGFRSTTLRLEGDVTQQQLLDTVARLNADDTVDGFIVQLPLPPHIDEQLIIEAIDYRKDVDGFHPVNVGRVALGLPGFVAATPQGIITLMERYGIATAGRRCVVVGRSNIVGKPVASLLMRKAQPGNCTVTICHSATPHLEQFTRQADILITAVGQPGLVTAGMVRPGVAVFDVGITRVPSSSTPSGWHLLGDVDFDSVAPLCSFITPIPGGVGPMTIASLMQNTLRAYQNQ